MKTKKLALKGLSTLFFLLILVFSFAQVDVVTAQQAAAAAGSKSNTGGILIGVLLLAGALLMIGHMLSVLFKSKRFKGTFSVDAFLSSRQGAGKSEKSTDEENAQCNDLLNQAFNTWSHIEKDSEGIEYRKPKRMKEILKSALYLQRVIDLEPTDAQIVETLNEYKEVVRSNEKRSFDGSWKLVTLGLLIALVIGFITKTEKTGFMLSTLMYGAYFWVPVVVYYISSLTPQFLIDKRANRGGGNVSTGLVAMALGILGSGVTVRTYYSDGSTEDDPSGHFVAWMLGIIALVAVALTIIFWAVLNYVRNYLLFF